MLTFRPTECQAIAHPKPWRYYDGVAIQIFAFQMTPSPIPSIRSSTIRCSEEVKNKSKQNSAKYIQRVRRFSSFLLLRRFFTIAFLASVSQFFLSSAR